MSDAHGRLIHEDYWNNHPVEIIDHGDYRSLYYGSHHLQGRMSLTSPQDLVLSYTCYMVFGLLIDSRPGRVLVTGIGSGSFIRFLQHHFPHCLIDAVDNSPNIIKAAKGYFSLMENERVAIYCCDGYRFLQENKHRRYDLILVDAFDAQGMAPSIYSESFFTLCAASLAEKGILSCNLWSNKRRLLREIRNILARLFAGLLFLPVHNHGNIVALAMPYETPWPRIIRKSKELTTLSKRFNLDFRQMVEVAKRNNLTLPKRLSTLFH